MFLVSMLTLLTICAPDCIRVFLLLFDQSDRSSLVQEAGELLTLRIMEPLVENEDPAHRALEFCGVEDETSLIKNCRPTSCRGLPLGITSSSLVEQSPPPLQTDGFSRTSSASSMAHFSLAASSTSSQRSAMTKAVLAWDVGRQRRAMVASNPGRSEIVTNYFQQELLKLIKRRAHE